jgi:hypothetical protein
LRWALTITPEAVGGAAWAKDQRAALWRRQCERFQGTCRTQLFRPVAAVVASHSRYVVAGQQVYRHISLLVTWHCCLERFICSDADGSLVVRRALQTRMRLTLRGQLALPEPTVIITGRMCVVSASVIWLLLGDHLGVMKPLFSRGYNIERGTIVAPRAPGQRSATPRGARHYVERNYIVARGAVSTT